MLYGSEADPIFTSMAHTLSTRPVPAELTVASIDRVRDSKLDTLDEIVSGPVKLMAAEIFSWVVLRRPISRSALIILL